MLLSSRFPKKRKTKEAPLLVLYATQIAYVEEEGKAKYMMIGFDEDKRMFIQYEVQVKEKSPTQAKKYLD